MSGWSVIHTGWSVSTDGKETILIGENTLFAMRFTEEMHRDMKNKSVAFGLVSQVMANSIRMLGLARPNNNSRSKKVNRSKSRKTRKKQTKTRNRSETNIATKTTNHRKELTL